jgi:hypothetical protein
VAIPVSAWSGLSRPCLSLLKNTTKLKEQIACLDLLLLFF